MPRDSAIECAAALLRSPVSVTRMRSQSLPGDVRILLHILTGDSAAEAEAARKINKPTEFVREAAEFYVKQVMLHDAADPYRLLGATPEAPRSELRSNLALLLRWLHPDVAKSETRMLTGRVIGAWNELKVPETKAALDHAIAKRSSSAKSRRGKTASKRPETLPKARRMRRVKTDQRGTRLFGKPRRLAVMVAGVAAVVGCALYLPIEAPEGVADYLGKLSRYAQAIQASFPGFQSNEEGRAVVNLLPKAPATCAPHCPSVQKGELRP